MKIHPFSGPAMRWQGVVLFALFAFGALFAPALFAQDLAPAVSEVEVAVVEEAAAPVFDSGNVAWMLTSTLLVLLMVVPGLALFYGGMVRSKNVLSVLMQVLVVFSMVIVVWMA